MKSRSCMRPSSVCSFCRQGTRPPCTCDSLERVPLIPCNGMPTCTASAGQLYFHSSRLWTRTPGARIWSSRSAVPSRKVRRCTGTTVLIGSNSSSVVAVEFWVPMALCQRLQSNCASLRSCVRMHPSAAAYGLTCYKMIFRKWRELRFMSFAFCALHCTTMECSKNRAVDEVSRSRQFLKRFIRGRQSLYAAVQKFDWNSHTGNEITGKDPIWEQVQQR